MRGWGHCSGGGVKNQGRGGWQVPARFGFSGCLWVCGAWAASVHLTGNVVSGISCCCACGLCFCVGVGRCRLRTRGVKFKIDALNGGFVGWALVAHAVLSARPVSGCLKPFCRTAWAASAHPTGSAVSGISCCACGLCFCAGAGRCRPPAGSCNSCRVRPPTA